MEGSEEESRLLPPERVALMAARSMLRSDRNPGINVTTMLVMTIERLIEETNEPRH
jgi:hypothetical protein